MNRTHYSGNSIVDSLSVSGVELQRSRNASKRYYDFTRSKLPT